MADFLHTTTLAVELSVNDKPEGWVAIPRDAALAALAIPAAYRKWDGSKVVEMDAGEKATVDASIKRASKDAAVAQVNGGDRPDLLRALSLVVIDEINALRTRAGLAARTIEQFKTALAAKMGA